MDGEVVNGHGTDGDWTPITCRQRDLLIHRGPSLVPQSSLTDMHGSYGNPIVFTEWGDDVSPVLQDFRYPPVYDGPGDGSQAYRKPCEHYINPDRRALLRFAP